MKKTHKGAVRKRFAANMNRPLHTVP